MNGYPLNSYFLYRTDGYFKDQAEVDRYYALYGEGKEDLTGVGAGSASRLRPGDTKRLDLNGDYKISGAGNENSDLQYLGDSNPHFVFGFTLGGSWKGIDVNECSKVSASSMLSVMTGWLILFRHVLPIRTRHIWERHGQRAIRMLNSLA